MSLMDVFVKIGADTSGLEDGVKKSEGLASSLGKGFGTAMKVAGAAVAGATTAVAGFAAASVKVGSSFDSSMSQVAATMGKTVDEIGELRDFAQEMGSTTAFSATQAADALNYMALAGYDAETSMKMLPNVLNLAAAGSMDLATASDMVTDAQSALGLSLEETEQLVDMMAKTSSKSNTSVQQLGDAMLTIGGTAKTLSGGTNELSTALGILADNGIKGAEGGTKLRNIVLSLSAPTDKAAQMLNSLGVSTVDATGNLRPLEDIMGELNTSLEGMGTADKADIINTIFNKQDIAGVNALLDTSKDRWNELSTAIDDSAGAADKMAKTQLDNLEGDITLFKSALEGAQIAISDGLTPQLRDFVQFGSNGLSQITEAFKEGGFSGAIDAFGSLLSEGLTMIIEKVPSFIDAGMRLLGAVGQGILDNLPAIIDAAVKITVQLTEGLAQATPQLITGAITIITALASALIENAPLIADGIFSAMEAAVNTVFPQMSGLFSTLFEGLSDAVSMLSDFLGWVTSGSSDAEVFRGVIIGLAAAVGAYSLAMELMSIKEKLAVAATKGLEIAQGALNAVMSMNPIGILLAAIAALVAAFIYLWNTNEDFRNFWIGLWDSIVNTCKGVVDAIVQFFTQTLPEAIVTFFTQTLPNGINTAINFLSQLPEKMAYWAGYAIGSFIKFIAELPSKMWDIFTTVISKAVTFGNNISSKARETAATFLKNMVNGIANLPSNLWNIFTSVIAKATELASNLVNKAIEMARGFVSNLVDGVSSLPSKFGEIGSQIVSGLWNGIKGGWDWLKNKVSDLANSLFQGAKDALGIHSPSRKFKWIGQMIDEGLASGIDKFSYLVDGSLGDLGVLDYVNTAQPQLAIAGNYGGGGDYNQTINIYSPTALTPSEVARQTRNATRDMVLELRGKR